MTHKETIKKLAELEALHMEKVTLADKPARPAEIAGMLTPCQLEALAAAVKQYSHDPRISTAAKNWAAGYTTCLDTCPAAPVWCKMHPVHIDQTARAAAALNNR